MAVDWFENTAGFLSDFATAQEGHATAFDTVENHLWVIGGRTDGVSGNPGTLDIQILDLNTGTWSNSAISAPVATIGSGTVSYACATFHNGSLYLAGGFQTKLLVLDGSSWAEVGSLPTQASASYLKSKLFSAGGKLCYRGTDDGSGTSQWYEVNTSTGAFSALGTNPQSLVEFSRATCVNGSVIYEFNGITSGSAETNLACKLDVSTGTYTALTNVPAADAYSSAWYNSDTNEIYLVGGTASLGTVRVYNVSGDSYTSESVTSTGATNGFTYGDEASDADGVLIIAGGHTSIKPAGSTSAEVIAFGQESGPDLTPPPAVPGDRVRSSVSEDAGSLLDSVSLNAVDASISEAFLLDTSLSPTTAYEFVEALAPGTAAARYYPLPRQSTEYLNDYSGETILSRMARTYPPPVMAKAVDYTAAGEQFTIDGTTYATPKGVLTQLFTDWASTYSWFGFETVPDLRIKVEALDTATYGTGVMTPTEYGLVDASLIGPGNTLENIAVYGIIGSEIVFYPQDDDNKLTMRQMLDELLAPFPGTVVRANASGNLEIVPSYGPDATDDASPVVTLSDKDAYTVTTGQPDPTGIINECTIRSQPYVWTEDGGAYTSSYFDLATWDYGEGNLQAAGVDEDLSGTIIGDYSNQTIKDWQPLSNTFVDTDGKIKLTDTGGTKYVSIDYFTNCGSGEGSFSTGDITLTDLPMDGKWHNIIYATQGAIGQLIVDIDGRHNKDSKTVSLRVGDRTSLRRVDVFACSGTYLINTLYQVRVSIADASNVWQADSKTVTGTYTQENAGDDPIPTDSVGYSNAVDASVATYGVRSAELSMTGYGVEDGNVLNRMARAYVYHAIQPNLIRTVEQSVWRAFPIKFSHMGEPVQLPSGEVGRLINRAYVDDFGSNYGQGTLASTVKVEVTDTTGAGSVDTTTVFLKLDDGTPFVLDDGSTSEVG